MLTEQGIAGRDVQLTPDSVTGVVAQNAESTGSSLSFNTSGDLNFGAPMLLSAVVGASADGTVNVAIFNKNCPFKMKIVDAWLFVRSKRTGGTPDHKVRLFKGDGAGSETFTAISDNLDVDSTTLDAATRFTTLDDAQDTIEADKSLRATLVVGGSTSGGSALVEFHVLAVPVK